MALVTKHAKCNDFSLTVTALTPARIKALERYADDNDRLDRLVVLDKKAVAVAQSTENYEQLSIAKKDGDSLKSRVMNYLYKKKYCSYADSEDPKERANMANINRYVNNAVKKFRLTDDEKETLEDDIPGYLLRFAVWYDEDNEDTSEVVCVLCASGDDVFQCDHCHDWMCLICAGAKNGAPSSKRHHNPLHEDRFGCSKPLGIADCAGEGWLTLWSNQDWVDNRQRQIEKAGSSNKYSLTVFNTHADLYAPPFESDANQIVMEDMKNEAIEYGVFQIMHSNYERKRKNIGDDHNETRFRYILDYESDENQNLEITMGEVGTAKEYVPDDKCLSSMKMRTPWTVEQWHKHITTAAKSAPYQAHIVLGMYPEETDPAFVKGWFKQFMLKWHDDKMKQDLSTVQKGMVHEMLPLFQKAKETFVREIKKSNRKYMRDNEKEDAKELHGLFDPDSDDDY